MRNEGEGGVGEHTLYTGDKITCLVHCIVAVVCYTTM